jgi:MFS family permease
MELTGSVWVVYELTRSPLLLAVVGIARAVPAVILSPIAGVIVDRVNQRKLLAATQALAGVASMTLGILILTGAVELWHVYVQVAVQSAITAFDAGVRQALFPRLIPRTRIAEAVTLSSIAARTASLFGPALGGIVIAGFGEAAPFVVNAATNLPLMAAVALMRDVPARVEGINSTFRNDLSEGIRHVLGTPVLSGLLKLEIVFGVFQVNPVIITIVGRELLGVGAEGVGGLLAAPALGALAGVASLLVFGSSRRPGRFNVLCTFAYAAAMVAFAVSREYVVSIVILALTGFLDALATVTRNSLMQLAAPSKMRGRIMANMGMVTRGIGPLAQTQSGFLVGAIGSPLAIVGAGGALALSATLTALANPALWKFSSDDDPDSAAQMPPAPDSLGGSV